MRFSGDILQHSSSSRNHSLSLKLVGPSCPNNAHPPFDKICPPGVSNDFANHIVNDHLRGEIVDRRFRALLLYDERPPVFRVNFFGFFTRPIQVNTAGCLARYLPRGSRVRVFITADRMEIHEFG